MGELSESLMRELSEVLGARLDHFVVRAFDGEVRDLDQLSDSPLLVGGEVHFQFGERSLFVSWESGRGSLGFSITAQPQSAFAEDCGLQDWDVGALPPWRQCVGKTLRGASIFAHDDTPHVVELLFEDESIWLADGYEDQVGNGDDLIVSAGRYPVDDNARLIWSAYDDRANDQSPHRH